MYCIKCGAKITDDALYCVKCGAKRIPDNIIDERAAQTSTGETKAGQNTDNGQAHGTNGKNIKKKKKKRVLLIVLASIAATIALELLFSNVIKPAAKYQNAVSLMNEEKYEEAIALFTELDGFGDSDEKIDECYSIIQPKKYNEAVSLMDSGSYEQAIPLFSELGDYKDSEAKLSECVSIVKEKGYAACEVGDTVYFGDYHGASAWLVLDRQDGKALLISKEAVDVRKYNFSVEEDTVVTWETCDLRRWLNGEYLDTTFSADEKARIADTYVVNDDNSEYGTDGGNDTTDKVFLLSVDEAEKYFSSDEDRMCVPTEYAKANGIEFSKKFKKDNKGTCYWWLRSPGINSVTVSIIYFNGNNDHSVPVLSHTVGVRPAMWINVDSE